MRQMKVSLKGAGGGVRRGEALCPAGWAIYLLGFAATQALPLRNICQMGPRQRALYAPKKETNVPLV